MKLKLIAVFIFTLLFCYPSNASKDSNPLNDCSSDLGLFSYAERVSNLRIDNISAASELTKFAIYSQKNVHKYTINNEKIFIALIRVIRSQNIMTIKQLNSFDEIKHGYLSSWLSDRSVPSKELRLNTLEYISEYLSKINISHLNNDQEIITNIYDFETEVNRIYRINNDFYLQYLEDYSKYAELALENAAKESFALLINEIFADAQITKKELSKLIGIGYGTILSWSNKTSYPQISEIERVIKILHSYFTMRNKSNFIHLNPIINKTKQNTNFNITSLTEEIEYLNEADTVNDLLFYLELSSSLLKSGNSLTLNSNFKQLLRHMMESNIYNITSIQKVIDEKYQTIQKWIKNNIEPRKNVNVYLKAIIADLEKRTMQNPTKTASLYDSLKSINPILNYHINDKLNRYLKISSELLELYRSQANDSFASKCFNILLKSLINNHVLSANEVAHTAMVRRQSVDKWLKNENGTTVQKRILILEFTLQRIRDIIEQNKSNVEFNSLNLNKLINNNSTP